ncbi:MAG: hypothetical protein EDM03_07670 [Porphyrobacter sp. IPPAS B-1204]|nr:MAG: hypothetical protein EDM03_07670 [Porphyrobacter sp. IPPAS B-1204]
MIWKVPGLLAAAMIAASPPSATTQTLRVEPRATIKVDIEVCAPAVYLEARGNGKSDLDFIIYDPEGEWVHSDLDDTDIVFQKLENPVAGTSCLIFVLEVINQGAVPNDLLIEVKDA